MYDQLKIFQALNLKIFSIAVMIIKKDINNKLLFYLRYKILYNLVTIPIV